MSREAEETASKQRQKKSIWREAKEARKETEWTVLVLSDVALPSSSALELSH